DNTVVLDRIVLQIDKQRGRRTCAGLPVLVRRHLDGRHSVWWGPRCLGLYSGAPLDACLSLKADRSFVKTDRTDHLLPRGGGLGGTVVAYRGLRPFWV